jgi:phosphoglycerol transferase MdoB-like AlkP superfamily enzyme
MPNATTLYRVLRPFLLLFIFIVAMLSLFRAGILVWQHERIDHLSTFILVLLNGLRIDISTLSYLLFIPALFHSLMLYSEFAKIWLSLLRLWFFVCAVSVLFFELATPTFINEYDLRPNRLFIEYIVYPKEVFGMLMEGHLLPVLITTVSLVISSLFIWKLITRIVNNEQCLLVVSQQQKRNEKTRLTLLASFVLIVLVLFVGARGTLGHRPINPSVVYFTTDPLINSLTLNSIYSVAFAWKQLGGEIHASKVYGKLSDERVIQLVRESTGATADSFISDQIPTLRKQSPIFKGKPKNLVIVLQESLSARFVGSLGGSGITPNLDEIMASGWSFDRLYATGTRSVRGIEAVVTGFTPTPARSVVKLDKSQHNFFTIASLLSRHNYETQFIYGGESHFDNMKSFFLGNGFKDIVDGDQIKDPVYVGSWGACDQSLFNQAHTELSAMHKTGKPFFSLVFTSSNHDPFDIPQGFVPVIDSEDDRDRAIRYADYALGNFIKKAKQSDYWEDTIFLVVADHDARVYGPELVPIKSFHIPGVILGKDIVPRQDERLASQIDLAPTLLSLMGIDDYYPMLGHDLTQSNVPERAMMQFDKNFAYMTNEEVAILQPNKLPTYYKFNREINKLEAGIENPNFGEIALAHVLFGSLAYEHQWFRLEPQEAITY